MASLRELFERGAIDTLDRELANDKKRPFYKKFGFFFCKIGLLNYHGYVINNNDFPLFYGFICPNCLKFINYDDFNIVCPICDKIYKNSDGHIRYLDKEYIDISLSNLQFTIFKECPNCLKPIKYINCYHCNKPIDLFALYDEKELEAIRYE